MNRIYYTTFSPLTKALVLILAAVLLFASYTVATEIDRVHAEEITTPGYILCKDYVIIRQWGSRHAVEIGQLDPCDEVEVDGRTKDGFAHIVAPMDGWVWAGNIVFSPVEEVNRHAYVTAKKRVACRKWCDGPQIDEKPWMITGSECRVYYMDSEWAVTSRGYVKVEYLEVEQ